jgi:hypothetical protein
LHPRFKFVQIINALSLNELYACCYLFCQTWNSDFKRIGKRVGGRTHKHLRRPFDLIAAEKFALIAHVPHSLDQLHRVQIMNILAGLTPMKNVGMARYMKKRVPGMDVPDEIVDRLAGTPKEKQAEEGIKICIESIERLKQVEGVAGFHIMAIEWEEKVPQIVESAGLYPRPKVD